MKIYIASSWRNEFQQVVVAILRELGHEVYDFKNPPHGNSGFAWSDIDPNWENWTSEEYRKALHHPLAQKGFKSDLYGMQWADCCVMVLPCGRSANTEAGWMKGAGKEVFVYQPIPQEPELMYKIYDYLLLSEKELRKQFTMKFLDYSLLEKVAWIRSGVLSSRFTNSDGSLNDDLLTALGQLETHIKKIPKP